MEEMKPAKHRGILRESEFSGIDTATTQTRINEENDNDRYYGLGLGVEGTDEIRRVIFLEVDFESKRMRVIILENVAKGMVDRDEAHFATHVNKCEDPI
ncbi:hypothetical protein VNO77_04125 [Canavalia gladiata]|uniref:Uncharacterized protein n=1 Tax=Canavalia gladiata TaxID=3824 RepID=A0AAN9RCW3_CANGL